MISFTVKLIVRFVVIVLFHPLVAYLSLKDCINEHEGKARHFRNTLITGLVILVIAAANWWLMPVEARKEFFAILIVLFTMSGTKTFITVADLYRSEDGSSILHRPYAS